MFSSSARSKRRRRHSDLPSDDPVFAAKQRKTVPHAFVLDALASLSPETHSMFGCLAVYVEDKIVFVLRDKPHDAVDNGVWIATTHEHHESLRRQFPSMRSIHVFRKKATGWQLIPADAGDFEEATLRACELVLAKDSRIGKVPPAPRRSRARIR